MVAPSGRFVYASNRGHDSLAIYAVDHETGQLALVGHQSSQGVGPRAFTIDPSGALLLAANQDTDTVVTFWIDPESGMLRPTGHVAAVPTPVCLATGQRLKPWLQPFTTFGRYSPAQIHAIIK
jgi:6-phosphogluconolactonase